MLEFPVTDRSTDRPIRPDIAHLFQCSFATVLIMCFTSARRSNGRTVNSIILSGNERSKERETLRIERQIESNPKAGYGHFQEMLDKEC